jgi:hypothetical protein
MKPYAKQLQPMNAIFDQSFLKATKTFFTIRHIFLIKKLVSQCWLEKKKLVFTLAFSFG